MLLFELDLYSVEPMTLGDFCNIFQPNTDEDQKKAFSERGAPVTVPYVKSVPDYCITFIKRLHEGLSWQLLRKKPLSSLG